MDELNIGIVFNINIDDYHKYEDLNKKIIPTFTPTGI